MIIFILLSLFAVWNSINEEEIVTVQVIVQKEKKVEVATLFQKNLNEVIETPSIVKIEKIVVNIGGDRNTTKETNLTLEANLTNHNEDYHYIWKEEGNIIGTGQVLTKTYSKGLHLVEVEVFTGDNLVGKDELLVTAWDYVKNMIKVEKK